MTFAFVTFRIIQPVLQANHIGTPQEDLAAAAWACWAVPLLITELITSGAQGSRGAPDRLNPRSPFTPF